MEYNEFGLRVEYLEYTVKKGDSLYTIAKKHNTTVQVLTDINMLTTNNIFPGQVLLIPKVDENNQEYYFENYIINPGDTVESIAAANGVDPVLIGLYNDFSSYQLMDGQIIKIPKNNTYIIKNNDTVETVLSKANKTAEEILKANANEWFKVGTKIYL